MITDPEHYYEALHSQNQELELEVQIQCEENEKLREEIKRLKTAYRNHIKAYKSLIKAGRKMYDFIENGIMSDLFYDEILDAANLAQEKWYDVDVLLNQRRQK